MKKSTSSKKTSKKDPTKADLQRIKDRIVYLRKEEYRCILDRDRLNREIRDTTAYLKDLNNSLELKERMLRETSAKLKKYEEAVKKRGITGKMLGGDIRL